MACGCDYDGAAEGSTCPSCGAEGYDAGRKLYRLAEQADARYSETVRSRTGKTRWTLTEAEARIPEVLAAYRAKVSADEAWASFQRWARA